MVRLIKRPSSSNSSTVTFFVRVKSLVDSTCKNPVVLSVVSIDLPYDILPSALTKHALGIIALMMIHVPQMSLAIDPPGRAYTLRLSWRPVKRRHKGAANVVWLRLPHTSL